MKLQTGKFLLEQLTAR